MLNELTNSGRREGVIRCENTMHYGKPFPFSAPLAFAHHLQLQFGPCKAKRRDNQSAFCHANFAPPARPAFCEQKLILRRYKYLRGQSQECPT